MGNTASIVEPGKFIIFNLVDGTKCRVITTNVNMFAELKEGRSYDTRRDTIYVVDTIYNEVKKMDISGPITVQELKPPFTKSTTVISKDELLHIIQYTDRSHFKNFYDGGMASSKRKRRRSEVDMLTS